MLSHTATPSENFLLALLSHITPTIAPQACYARQCGAVSAQPCNSCPRANLACCGDAPSLLAASAPPHLSPCPHCHQQQRGKLAKPCRCLHHIAVVTMQCMPCATVAGHFRQAAQDAHDRKPMPRWRHYCRCRCPPLLCKRAALVPCISPARSMCAA